MFSQASQRELAGVHPDLRALALRALDLSPVKFEIADGLRTLAEQKTMVAKGVSQTLDSRHLYGLAVDIVPNIEGIYTRPSAEQWAALNQIAAAFKQASAELGVSVTWGGDWRTFKDGWHFELPKSAYPNGTKESKLQTSAPFAAGRFEQCAALLKQTEGGWNEHDPSMWGIHIDTLSSWRGQTVSRDTLKNLTWDEAKTIYRVRYWSALACDQLPAGLDYAVFDFGVHSGVPIAATYLQEIVGTAQDGIIGPVTLAAVRQHDAAGLINALMEARWEKRMKSRPTFETNKAGWANRIDAVRATALQMIQADTKQTNETTLANFTWWQFAILAVAAFLSRNRNQEGKLDMSTFATMFARMLIGTLGGMNGSKSVNGLWGIALGVVVYMANHYGVQPAELSPNVQAVLGTVLSWLSDGLFAGGGALTLVGVGHKMGKVDPNSVRNVAVFLAAAYLLTFVLQPSPAFAREGARPAISGVGVVAKPAISGVGASALLLCKPRL